MRAAARPHINPRGVKLLLVDEHGIAHLRRTDFPSLLEPGDLVVANDAATLPASLSGLLAATGARIEVRLAGSASLRPAESLRFTAVMFGAGDYHTPTEQRPLPPRLFAGDQLLLGPLRARVRRILGHPRLIDLQFEGRPDGVWEGIARHGRPIQYRVRAAAARDLGHVDANRRTPGRVRGAVRGVPARLVDAAGNPSPRRSLYHDHPRGRDLIDWRSGTRCASTARRAVRDPLVSRLTHRCNACRRWTRHRIRHHRRARARRCCQPGRNRPERSRHGNPSDRPPITPESRRCDCLGDARARNESLRTAQGVR